MEVVLEEIAAGLGISEEVYSSKMKEWVAFLSTTQDVSVNEKEVLRSLRFRVSALGFVRNLPYLTCMGRLSPLFHQPFGSNRLLLMLHKNPGKTLSRFAGLAAFRSFFSFGVQGGFKEIVHGGFGTGLRLKNFFFTSTHLHAQHVVELHAPGAHHLGFEMQGDYLVYAMKLFAATHLCAVCSTKISSSEALSAAAEKLAYGFMLRIRNSTVSLTQQKLPVESKQAMRSYLNILHEGLNGFQIEEHMENIVVSDPEWVQYFEMWKAELDGYHHIGTQPEAVRCNLMVVKSPTASRTGYRRVVLPSHRTSESSPEPDGLTGLTHVFGVACNTPRGLPSEMPERLSPTIHETTEGFTGPNSVFSVVCNTLRGLRSDMLERLNATAIKPMVEEPMDEE